MHVEVERTAELRDRERSDRALAARIAGGDMDAFAALMHRLNRTLYRVARSILNDDAQAEDAVQNAYLRAYRAMRDFQRRSALSTWLVRIVTNEALSQLRRSRRGAEIIVPAEDWRRAHADADGHTPEPTAVGDAAGDPDTAAFRGEVRQLIESKIDQLPEAFRAVFVLRAVEELAVDETARELGLLPATVRTRFFRARGLLREALSREIDLSMETVFGFAGDRCNGLVLRVLGRLAP
jgi:RNA polymerase sigma-70 factor (ECF subfamily)